MAEQNAQVFGGIRSPDELWLARADSEPAIEPELAIIDTHVHFWHPQGVSRYFADDFAKDIVASGHNVVASVFAECRTMYRDTGPEHLRCVGETEFAAGMAAVGDSGRYGSARMARVIVGFADLTLEERLLRETLEAHVATANGRFRGVRLRAKWDADPAVAGKEGADAPGLYLTPEFDRGLDILTSMGLSFDASVFHPQLSDVAAMARAHPEANIVLIHTGSPVGHSSYAGKRPENYAAWLAGMKDVASCPNVTVKLGGILMHVGDYNFAALDKPLGSAQLADLWRPYFEPCIELFGAARCMADSNFPVDKAGLSYGTTWNMLKRILSGCSQDEKRQVLSETAKRVYRIEL